MAAPTPLKRNPPKPKKRVNILGMLIVFVLLIALGIGLTHLFNYLVLVLTDFILNNLEVNEFYVGKLVGFTFFLCASLLVMALIIVDGDQKRIQNTMRHYGSKMIVKEYIPEDKPVGGQVPSGKGSIREAASVRPKASALESDYKEGRVDGTFKEIHPNGNTKREVRYLNGKLHGLFRMYYEDGQVEHEAVYREGLIEGIFRSYYDDGSRHQEKQYRDGKLNGVYKAWDEHGMPFFEISYINDVQHGPDKIYDQKGVLQYEDTYVKGIQINRKTYDEYGILKYDQNFEGAMEQVEVLEGEEQAKKREMEAKERRKNKRKKKEKETS